MEGPLYSFKHFIDQLNLHVKADLWEITCLFMLCVFNAVVIGICELHTSPIKHQICLLWGIVPPLMDYRPSSSASKLRGI